MQKKPALINARLFDLFKTRTQDFLISPTFCCLASASAAFTTRLTGSLGLFDNASAAGRRQVAAASASSLVFAQDFLCPHSDCRLALTLPSFDFSSAKIRSAIGPSAVRGLTHITVFGRLRGNWLRQLAARRPGCKRTNKPRAVLPKTSLHDHAPFATITPPTHVHARPLSRARNHTFACVSGQLSVPFGQTAVQLARARSL